MFIKLSRKLTFIIFDNKEIIRTNYLSFIVNKAIQNFTSKVSILEIATVNEQTRREALKICNVEIIMKYRTN